MLPRLQAEESIHSAAIVGVGSGSLKQQPAREIQESWRRLAHPGDRQVDRATPQDLSAMGIGYSVVPREVKP